MSNTTTNKNTIYNTIKSAFSIIYPLVTFPYVSRVLMAENIGKINFGSSIVSYFSLLASLGITTYAVRECSTVKTDRKKLEKTASEIYSINILSTLLSYVVLVILLLVAQPLNNYRELICIQSTAILFATIGADWINTTMEDFRYISIRTVGMQILSIVLMFIFVRNADDYIKYAIISVLASSGANVINIFYRKKYVRLHFVFKMNVRCHLKSIILLFSLMIAQIIYTSSDKTIIGLCRGDIEVGLYSTSVSIYNIVNTMVASIAWVVMPQLSSAFAKKDYKEVNDKLKYALNFILVLGLPCFAGIEVISDQLIVTIAGESFVEAATSLRILGFALLCSFIGGWVGNMIMIPSGKEKICLISSIISAIVNIVLNLIFIPFWGLNIAAVTTVIAELIGVIIIVPHIDNNIRIESLKNMIISPLVGALGIFITGIVVKKIFIVPAIVSLMTIVLSVVLYVGILLLFKNEFFLGFVKPVIRKIVGEK